MRHIQSIQFYFFLLIFFSNSSLFAQKNFLPALIIDAKNDTLNGYIDFRDWVTNPKTINFKSSEDGEIIQFSPVDILYFTVADQHYISKIFTLDETPVKDKDTPLEISQILVTDTFFLKTIVYSEDGMSLYAYHDTNGKDHFIMEKNNIFTELLMMKYLSKESGFMVYFYIFQQQLKSATANCPDLESKINNSKYHLSDLVEIISTYNTCSGYNEKYTSPVTKNKKLFGVIAGPTASRITYPTNSTFDEENYNFGVGFGSGFFLDIDLPGKRQTMWLNTELYINKFTTQGNTTDTSSFFYEETSIQFNILDLNALLSFKLQMNTPHFRPYFYLGPAATYSLINNNEKITTKQNKYTHDVTTKIYLNEIEKSNIHFTYVAGTGISLNNTYFLDFRYGKAFSLSQNAGSQDDFSLFFRYAF